jgi:Uncharacterized protein conserved in bacteria
LLVAATLSACGRGAPATVATPAPQGSARTVPATSTAPVRAKHMLFRVHGRNGSTVYLLGSVHLLSPEESKLPAEVDSAFTHARTIAFETSLDSVQKRAPELLALARYPAGTTLQSSLSPAGLARADSLLKLYGIPLAQVSLFKPWFVSLLMSQVVMQRAHFQAQYGVDMQINAWAHRDGKPTIGLEPVDFQIHLFDRIPPADQEKMITTSSGPDSSAHMLTAIKDAWVSGNVSMLDSLLNRATDPSPTFFKMMVADRNRSWIPKIEELLNAKGDALVVVGAAHLVGKQGLVALLEAKGYSVEQM